VYRHTADTGADLVTFFGAKPNDTLTFGARFTPPTSTNLGTMTFSWPAIVGASEYIVYTPCAGGYGFGSATTSYAFNEYDYCHKDPMDIVFIALDSTFRVSNYGFLSNVTWVPSSARALGGWTSAPTGITTVSSLPNEVMTLNGSLDVIANGDQLTYQ